MKIHVLPFGTLHIPQSILYGDDFPDDVDGVSPMYGVLIEHPCGNILCDTGLWLDDEGLAAIPGGELSFTEDDKIENRLATVGIAPEDIDFVVISHLHLDHSGNIHKFRNAKIVVNRADFEGTMVDYGLGRLKIMTPGYVENWVRHQPDWQLVDARETVLLPGVTLLAFGPGHTYGMLMVRLETERSGVVFLVQDLVYSGELYGKRKLPGIVFDEQGYFEAVETIRRLAEAEGAAVWFGHDIEQFSGLRHAPNGYYE